MFTHHTHTQRKGPGSTQPGICLQAREWNLDLGLPTSRTVRNRYLLSPTLWHFVIEPQLRQKSFNKHILKIEELGYKPLTRHWRNTPLGMAGAFTNTKPHGSHHPRGNLEPTVWSVWWERSGWRSYAWDHNPLLCLAAITSRKEQTWALHLNCLPKPHSTLPPWRY